MDQYFMKFSRRLSMAMEALKKINGCSSTGYMKNKEEIEFKTKILESEISRTKSYLVARESGMSHSEAASSTIPAEEREMFEKVERDIW